MTLSIEIRGIDELYRRLDRVAATTTLVPPMQRSVERVRRRVAEYPGSIPSGRWAAMTTPRQKRAFFARLRAGRISGSRTGKLGQSWTTRLEMSSGGIVGRVGTNRPYARWVQDRANQARFHQGRWRTGQAALEQERGAIEADFAQTIGRALRK
jgi:hypothetical protein